MAATETAILSHLLSLEYYLGLRIPTSIDSIRTILTNNHNCISAFNLYAPLFYCCKYYYSALLFFGSQEIIMDF